MKNLIRLKQLALDELESYVINLVFGSETGVIASYVQAELSAGDDADFIPYGNTYSAIPIVSATMVKPSGSPTLLFNFHNPNTSGVYVDFSNAIPSTGYSLYVSSHREGSIYGAIPDFFIQDAQGNIVVL